MKEKETPSKLDDLQARIDNARHKDQEEPGKKAPDPMRIGLELTSGVLVGGFLGFYLDKWLDTKPFLLIIFFLLGAAAGFRNIYRMVETPPENKQNPDKENK